jgi:hypothetical protein
VAETILLVFEGEKTEVRIFNKIKKLYFSDEKNTLVHASYNAEIYQLFKAVNEDPFLDIVELLRQRSEKNAESLSGIKRVNVSQVYLFFDYDNQATDATDEKIQSMLEFFNEETENGKLFISYPMVEAVKHISRDIDSCLSTCAVPLTVKKYKNLVSKVTSFSDLRKTTRDDWNLITLKTIKKANCIVHDTPEKPEYNLFLDINQQIIFENQLEKFIPYQKIAVLSGIPLFLVDYFGEKLYETL